MKITAMRRLAIGLVFTKSCKYFLVWIQILMEMYHYIYYLLLVAYFSVHTKLARLRIYYVVLVEVIVKSMHLFLLTLST